MNIGEDVRLLIADNFIKAVDELERSGVRRDLTLDGMEQALQMLRERDRALRGVSEKSAFRHAQP